MSDPSDRLSSFDTGQLPCTDADPGPEQCVESESAPPRGLRSDLKASCDQSHKRLLSTSNLSEMAVELSDEEPPTATAPAPARKRPREPLPYGGRDSFLYHFV